MAFIYEGIAESDAGGMRCDFGTYFWSKCLCFNQAITAQYSVKRAHLFSRHELGTRYI